MGRCAQGDRSELAGFAARLRGVRQAYAEAVDRPLMSSAEFAGLVDLSPPEYATYEAGWQDPPLSVLVALHRRTGVSLDWLIVGDATAARPRPRRA